MTTSLKQPVNTPMHNAVLYGFGRVGKYIIREFIQKNKFINIYIIDDNYTVNDIVSGIAYDSIYGNIFKKDDLYISRNIITIKNVKLFFNYRKYPEDSFIINATGGKINPLGNKPIYVTDSFDAKYGNNKRNIFTGSCDSIAIVPICQYLDSWFFIKNINVITIHPAMNNQSILDKSDIHLKNYQKLSIINNVIIKETSLQDILNKKFNKIPCLASSYRTPHDAVCSAIIDVHLEDIYHSEVVMNVMNSYLNEKGYENIDCSRQSLHNTRGYNRGLLKYQNGFLRIPIFYDNEASVSKSLNEMFIS